MLRYSVLCRGFYVALLLLCLVSARQSHATAAFSCTEAILRFKHFVEIDAKRVSKKRAEETIQEQLEYLYGAMANDDVKAAPKGNHEIQIGKKELTHEGKTRVHYTFKGPVLIQKGPRKKETFFLPRDPSEEGAYTASLDPKTGEVTAIEDQHYDSFGDFWYFFYPNVKGSRLKKGKDYDQVNGTIKRVKNTRRTYPEYERLVDKKTGTIPIAFFFGMDVASHSRDAMRSVDDGAQGYREIRRRLKNMGYSGRKMEPARMREILEGHRPEKPFVEIWEKDTPEGKIAIQLFYGPTGFMEPSKAFHYFYKDALQNSSVVIYDGHSGLGGHLDLPSIEEKEGFKFQVRPKKYQILFFNSCTSYSYYNIPYLHKGIANQTQSLDILTNGLATNFDAHQRANMAFIKAIDAWAMRGKKETYQNLAKVMEQKGELNLFSVNGDEDNPTKK